MTVRRIGALARGDEPRRGCRASEKSDLLTGLMPFTCLTGRRFGLASGRSGTFQLDGTSMLQKIAVKSRQGWTNAVRAAENKIASGRKLTLEGIVERGRALADAKDDLDHGEYG